MAELDIDFAQPNRPLSINEANQLHWAVKKRRLDPWRTATFAAWTAAGRPVVDGPVTVTVTFSFARHGRRDAHNYVGTNVKTIVDTLVSAGMVPDDTPDWVTVVDPVLRVDPADRARIVVERRHA